MASNVTESQAGVDWVKLREQLLAKRCLVVGGGEAHGGEVSEAVTPEFLSRGQADERLGRAFVLVPVVFVLVADGVEIHRETGVPVGAVCGVGHAGELRHQRPVGARIVHCDDAADGELGRALLELAHGADGVVRQLDLVTDPGLQVVGRPLVEPDRARREAVQRGDHRVRGGIVAELDFVHEVSENLGGFGRNFERGPGQGGIEKDARGAEFDAFAIRELKQLRLGVGELPMSREGRLRLICRRAFGRGLRLANEHEVGHGRFLDGFLQLAKRDKRVVGRHLRGLQAESAELRVADDRQHFELGKRGGGVFDRRHRCVARKLRRVVNAQVDHVTFLDI